MIRKWKTLLLVALTCSLLATGCTQNDEERNPNDTGSGGGARGGGGTGGMGGGTGGQ